MPRGLSKNQRKLLVLLFSGVCFGCAYTPQMQLRVIRETKKALEQINNEFKKQSFNSAINSLHRSKLITIKKQAGKTGKIILTKKGQQAAIFEKAIKDNKKIKKWDGKWRIVIFDIPEEIREVRDFFRSNLKLFNFTELQRSVFVSPYDSKKEVKYLADLHNVNKYIKFIVAESIQNDKAIKKLYNIK